MSRIPQSSEVVFYNDTQLFVKVRYCDGFEVFAVPRVPLYKGTDATDGHLPFTPDTPYPSPDFFDSPVCTCGGKKSNTTCADWCDLPK